MRKADPVPALTTKTKNRLDCYSAPSLSQRSFLTWLANGRTSISQAHYYVTGNFLDRTPVFTDPECCKVFLDELQKLNRNWPSKLITYVLMPDHLHLIANPWDGRIKEYTGQLKAVSAKAIVRANSRFVFPETDKGHQVWQESFKDVALWSRWMI
ncbi:MAG: transposase [Acidobacteria bacterium]|nr:transposase [Acidobacteriota bacterium]